MNPPDNKHHLAEIHAEGMQARAAGCFVADCPYAETTAERRAWIEGWHERDALDEDDPVEDEP